MKQALTQRELMGRLLDGHTVIDQDELSFRMIEGVVMRQAANNGAWYEASLHFNRDTFYDPGPPKPEKKTVTMYRPILKFAGDKGICVSGHSYEVKEDMGPILSSIEGWITEEVEYEVEV